MGLLRRNRRVDVPPVGVAVVPVFGPDARGAALFHAVTNANAASLNSAVRIDARGSNWGGWTTSPQQVMAPRGRLGGSAPIVDPVTTLDQERSAASGSVQRIFAERMAAGRFS